MSEDSPTVTRRQFLGNLGAATGGAAIAGAGALVGARVEQGSRPEDLFDGEKIVLIVDTNELKPALMEKWHMRTTVASNNENHHMGPETEELLALQATTWYANSLVQALLEYVDKYGKAPDSETMARIYTHINEANSKVRRELGLEDTSPQGPPQPDPPIKPDVDA